MLFHLRFVCYQEMVGDKNVTSVVYIEACFKLGKADAETYMMLVLAQ